MKASELREKVLRQLSYSPMPDQDMMIKSLCCFFENSADNGVFILQGYAGTGKTSLLAAFVKAFDSLKLPMVLLAPTGRAAKVFSSFANHVVYTIHKRIYRSASSNPSETSFFLAPNKDNNAIFIVDEASMIADVGGQVSLLEHLIRHIYSASGCRLILVGDIAQLPPVGQSDSPAMMPERLRQLGLDPIQYVLERPVRQAVASGILYNAVRIRNCMIKNPLPIPKIWANGFADVEVVSSEFFVERLTDSYSEVGEEETIVITRSNKRANQFNRGIRSMALYAEEELQRGERLVVAKNNYFWTKQIKELDFIANGDIIKVVWIGSKEEKYGHRFVDVDLELANSEISVSAKLMLDGLMSDNPSLTNTEMNKLYTDILAEKEGDELSKKVATIQNDAYFNAVQVKYAYCLTCHKAQGGQWKHVYIDIGYLQSDMLGIDFYRWLYTAITRASEKVFFINPSIIVE